jgi:hypothetical protein
VYQQVRAQRQPTPHYLAGFSNLGWRRRRASRPRRMVPSHHRRRPASSVPLERHLDLNPHPLRSLRSRNLPDKKKRKIIPKFRTKRHHSAPLLTLFGNRRCIDLFAVPILDFRFRIFVLAFRKSWSATALPRSRAGTLQSRSREKQSFFFERQRILIPPYICRFFGSCVHKRLQQWLGSAIISSRTYPSLYVL